MKLEHAYADYIDEEGLEAIRKLEQETGKTILAYYTPPAPADVDPEALNKIRDLEKKLCVRLVAYEAH